MSFGAGLGLLVALGVALPLVAHLLRRRRTETRVFPPARLVPTATPAARSRAHLEDRALLAVRALGVLALAVLGAAPFVTCSRLALDRPGGSAIALVIVIDDSMSMRASAGGEPRFARARRSAVELVESLRDGDVVGVVAAGAPARMLVAPSPSRDVATRALAAMTPSDRATDLDAALTLAGTLARGAQQPERRVVLLSDLADGSDKPLDAPAGVSTWTPDASLAAALPDCAVVRALRRGRDVRARVACGRAEHAGERRVEVVGPSGVLGFVTLRRERAQDVEIVMSDAAPAGAQLTARLTGSDAVPDDDAAPVMTESGALSVSVVLGPSTGASERRVSVVEEALGALDETLALRPSFSVPEAPEALAPHAVVVLDDPPGLPPEARAALRGYVERGGVAVALLGSRAGSAILGNTLEPFVEGAVRWTTSAPKGSDEASLAGLGATAAGLLDLAPKGRVLLDERATADATVLARWADGRPLVFTRRLGRGRVLVTTLGASLDESDLALRPAFLEILGRALSEGRARKGNLRSLVGARWEIAPSARVVGPSGPLPASDDGVLVPLRAGLYAVRAGDELEARVAEIDEREVDLSPRPAPPRASHQAAGATTSRVELSPYVAWALLALLALEAAVRLLTRSPAPRASAAP